LPHFGRRFFTGSRSRLPARRAVLRSRHPDLLAPPGITRSPLARFLFVSSDAGTRELLRRAFAQFAVIAEECDSTVEAFAHLARHYTGVVLDCVDVELALQLIAGIRHVSEDDPTAIIALLPADAPVQAALTLGTIVALNRPLQQGRLELSLQLGFGLTAPSKKVMAAKRKGHIFPRPLLSHK